MGEPRELQTLLPDDVSPVVVLDRSPPLLREITAAVCHHYHITIEQLLSELRHPARGLLIVLARRYTRETYQALGDWLGITNGNASALFAKTIGRLPQNELLRDDHDIIERRLAEVVIERTGGRAC